MTFDLVHGIRVDNPFRWLEDRQSPRTVEWLSVQSAHARRYLDALPGHAALVTDAARLLAAEVVEGLHLGREATYFLRRGAGDDQASLWMQTAAGTTRRLVDPARLDPSGRTSLDILAVSRDERVLAIAKRAGCGNAQSIVFVDPATGEMLDDELPADEYRGIVPVREADGASGVYYAAPRDGSWRLAWHRFGSAVAEDVTVFAPEGAGPLKLSVSMAQDGEHLLLLTARRGPPRTMDLHVLPVRGSGAARVLLRDTEFFGGGVTFDRHLYFLSHEHASNRRVMRIPLSGGRPEVIVPESDDVIRRVARAGDRMLLVTSKDGHDRIRLYDWNGERADERTGEAEVEPADRIIHLACHPLRRDFFVATESWQRPRTIWHWRATGAAEPWWERDAPLDPAALTLDRRECPRRDGERVPVSIIRPAAATAEGTTVATAGAEAERREALPTLLIAYGGYGVTVAPTLSLRNALWLAAGGQVAVAGVRGGGERGRQWHEAGAREHRQTAIDDLLDTADWLVAEGFTPPDRLALAGSSHAGTLVAAAMTQRPERFAAVICAMALLDLVRFETSPHGRWSAQELGTIADEGQFRALLSYSPYHRVRDGVAYPPVLFVSGDADTLVDPLHVRKMAARLQQATAAASDATSDRPILLSYDEHRGHRGQRPLAERARSLADQIAFLRAHVLMPTTTVTTNRSERDS